MAPRVLLIVLLAGSCAQSQDRYFAGGGTGVSILSSDARSAIDPQSSSSALYSAETGVIAHAYAGRHIMDYLSVQGAWSWNRNGLTFSSTSFREGMESAGEQLRRSSQNNLGADALLYFRDRGSFVRPFLSVGINWMHFRSEEDRTLVARNSPPLPPAAFTADEVSLRVAAGIDLMHPSGWGFRYAFLETLGRNPIGRRLMPPGRAGLMNFQNLFGVVRYFGGAR